MAALSSRLLLAAILVVDVWPEVAFEWKLSIMERQARRSPNVGVTTEAVRRNRAGHLARLHHPHGRTNRGEFSKGALTDENHPAYQANALFVRAVLPYATTTGNSTRRRQKAEKDVTDLGLLAEPVHGTALLELRFVSVFPGSLDGLSTSGARAGTVVGCRACEEGGQPLCMQRVF